MKFTESFDKTFWEYNYPVQLYKDEETKEITYVIYKPRKNACWDSAEEDETIPKEELNDFIDNSIEKLETAIELFKKFKAGEIDHIYYWDKKD